METTTPQTAAEAARSFRLAMRLQQSDPLAHQLALHEHFDRFVPQPARSQTCALPRR